MNRPYRNTLAPSNKLVGAIHELPLPTSEGPACQVRLSTFDDELRFTGD